MSLLTDRFRTSLEGSRAVTILSQATRSSQVLAGARKTVDQARTIDVTRTAADGVGSWIRSSRIGRAATDLTRRVGRYYDRSQVRSATDTGTDWTEVSRGYQWLTAEPEPDVIVIDLRDSLSVGPAIAFLDATLESLLPATGYSLLVQTVNRGIDSFWAAPVRVVSFVVLVATALFTAVASLLADGSVFTVIAGLGVAVIAALGTQVTMSWDELVETRTVQLLIAAFEPPPSPEQASRCTTGPDETSTADQGTSETESDS